MTEQFEFPITRENVWGEYDRGDKFVSLPQFFLRTKENEEIEKTKQLSTKITDVNQTIKDKIENFHKDIKASQLSSSISYNIGTSILSPTTRTSLSLTPTPPLKLTKPPRLSQVKVNSIVKKLPIHKKIRRAVVRFFNSEKKKIKEERKKWIACRAAYAALSTDALALGSQKSKTVGILRRLMENKQELFVGIKPNNFKDAYLEYHRNSILVRRSDAWIEKIDSLKDGECMIVDMTTSTHSMTGMLKKVGDTFTYFHSNTGGGLPKYHNSKIDDSTGLTTYQTVLVYEKISPDNAKQFLQRIPRFPSGSVENVYEKLIPILTTEKALEIEDTRYWDMGQAGGSCAGQSELALIQSLMSKEKYEIFYKSLLEESAIQMYKHIASALDTSYSAKVASLDIIRRLETMYRSWGQELPEDLQERRQKIEDVIKHKLPKSIKKTLSKYKPSKNNYGRKIGLGYD